MTATSQAIRLVGHADQLALHAKRRGLQRNKVNLSKGCAIDGLAEHDCRTLASRLSLESKQRAKWVKVTGVVHGVENKGVITDLEKYAESCKDRRDAEIPEKFGSVNFFARVASTGLFGYPNSVTVHWTVGGIMEWTAPAFEEVCLNCEINSYASAKL